MAKRKSANDQKKIPKEIMPTPSHLGTCAIPVSSRSSAKKLVADIHCPCGSEDFRMLYPGQTHDYQGRQVTCTAEIDGKFFYVIVAECLKCKQRHVLVDMDFHGWNGYICHDPKQAALPRPPLKAWNCTACSEDAFSVQVTINSEGMIDFVEETDGEFPAERWPDGFGYIDIAIVCIHCRHQPESWAGCETM